MSFFTKLGKKTIQAFIWRHKQQQIGKAMLERKNAAGGNTVQDLRSHYGPTVTKTVWY